MLVFATSDKGGTGRSVTGCNISYRRSLQGSDVCYVDFDFGSPTAGAIFDIDSVLMGTGKGGLHSYLQGRVAEPQRIDVWSESDRLSLRPQLVGAAGAMVLLPGDKGGGEFPMNREVVARCTRLFLDLEEEFELVLVDLSAGRSYAVEIVLEATAAPEMRSTTCRWLVFHRWTRQHIIAASELVFGPRGILEAGVERGHDAAELADSIRFVRTAVVDPDAPELRGMRPVQAAWLQDINRDLQELAARYRLGRSVMLGSIPLDPVLQWREQLIADADVHGTRIANHGTLDAFDELARRVVGDSAWEGL